MNYESIYNYLDKRYEMPVGRQHKLDADQIEEASFDRDIAYRIAYIYDYYHDGEPFKYTNLDPSQDSNKTMVEIKFMKDSSESLSKDQIAYHIQFRPSHECPLDYWEQIHAKQDVTYPIGLQIDIPDEKGIQNKWFICSKEINNQFPLFFVLPCNYNLHWVYDNKLFHMWAVVRSRNSYNSGTWRDNITQVPENQDQIWLPFNEISSNLYYDQRLIISAPMEKPITWRVSKPEAIHPKGIQKLTLAQDRFNPTTDLVDLENGIMIADYYSSPVTPQAAIEDPPDKFRITYSGAAPSLKVRGGYRTFTVSFRKSVVDWSTISFTLDDVDASTLLATSINGDKIKIRFLGDEQYLGKVVTMKVKDETGKIEASIELEVISL